MTRDVPILKTPYEIDAIGKAGSIVAGVLGVLKGRVKEGVTTLDLEAIAEDELRARGAEPAFKGYRGYPFCLCTSLNSEVVHGMPSAKKALKHGDIVSIDFGVRYEGFYADSAITVPVGEISEAAQKLLRVTEESLHRGIDMARSGNRLSDISHAVQAHVEAQGFSVVREFVGHGIGRELHEAPQVPNFGEPGRGLKLKPGMVLAIEPMINMGQYDIKILGDGWTAVTKDGSLSAHFEHTVAITRDAPRILTLP